MGMFDDLTCHYPLPQPDSENRTDFQTKSFDCEMERYTITAEGRLIYHYREWEETPVAELEDPENPWIGAIQVKAGSEKDVDKNYHGFIHFYGSAGYFMAKFTDGKVVEITKFTEESRP